MRTDTPQPIRLVDYQPPAYAVEQVRLDFNLEPAATRVKASLKLTRNGDAPVPLVLDGMRLKLISVSLDGEPLAASRYVVDDETLTIAEVPAAFTLETEVEINPQANTALEGLYMSGGRFCTQCEAEGFRKITYYPDRPDVLSKFTVRMEADKAAFPVLLANGNRTGGGDLEGGRHYAQWEDPFFKPCYLFALVAGELDELKDSFTTMSGRTIDLRIYVDMGQTARAAYAMDSLKRSMTWDEEAFGREYDLDLFMIVAVRDFNFGAMENKGLNIFNSSLVLADEHTATDDNYERIESVVAHEYFHNWTGDRITCRDWFQLCLKEGLTVFRDQSFSGDMRGEAVQRIKDVKALRARQFVEDAGPLAHPVRPSSYLKIDNFYTATIYDKGSEVIRMLKTILGEDHFRAGMDLYFERWDGHATTVEAFVACFADASGRDLTDFFGWYEQAGTPQVTVKETWDAAAQTLDLALCQSTDPTPGQHTKKALPIPLRLGLLDEDGASQTFTTPDGQTGEEATLILDKVCQTVRLTGVAKRPVLSLFRGFSAPIKVEAEVPADDRYVLMASDPDLFNRWEAGQALGRALILKRAAGQPDVEGERRFARALGRAMADQAAEPAFKALTLLLPSEADLAMAMSPADPAAIHVARDALRKELAGDLGPDLEHLHDQYAQAGAFSPDAQSAGQRALRNAALNLLVACGSNAAAQRAAAHYADAKSMTESIGGLNALMQLGGAAYDDALADFYDRWKDEPLVIDKWFSLQAGGQGEDTLGRVMGLTTHPAFDAKNPNRFRALVAAFAANPARFHDPSGAGYRFLADQIIAVDGFNPMLASRLVDNLGGWRRYTPQLGAMMREQLERIAEQPNLSKNVTELVGRALD